MLVSAEETRITHHASRINPAVTVPGSEEEEKISPWDKSISLKGGFGYKDNVLLSSFAPQSSSFTQAGLDLMVLRLPIDNTEFLFFASGEDRRYLHSVGVNKEQTLITQAQLKQALGKGWQAGLSLQYFYLDQVFDVSATEADLATVKLQGHGLTARPSLRQSFGTRDALQLELPLTRQYFISPLDDYWEGGPKLTWEHEYGYGSEWTASVGLNHRLYDHRSPADLSGNISPGGSLEFEQPAAEWAWRHHWDQKKRWRTVTKAGYEYNLDNGSGFYDYHRYQISQQIRYTAASWEVAAQAKWYRYQYPLRTLSMTDLNKRHLTGLMLTLRGHQTIYKSWKLFAEYEYERQQSNQAGFGYTVNTILSGVEWEF
jgi:hypothetical protein